MNNVTGGRRDDGRRKGKEGEFLREDLVDQGRFSM
jgi:hypothetical protein